GEEGRRRLVEQRRSPAASSRRSFGADQRATASGRDSRSSTSSDRLSPRGADVACVAAHRPDAAGSRWHESAMAFYRNHIYPCLVDRLGDPPPIQKVRRHVIPLAQGTVLEIGAGSGANFIYYDSTRVSKLYALEPNPGMIRRAERQRHRTGLKIEYLDLPGEHIPLEAGTIDTVVSTFTLCTIPGVMEAIRGLGRVLRPGGRLIFFELGLSPDSEIQRWQKRLEPLHHWLFDGLYLTRDIPALLTRGGFHIDQMETGYLARFPQSSTHCWWGTASWTHNGNSRQE